MRISDWSSDVCSSDLDPYLSRELVRYFPEPLQKKYARAMEDHRLKREIIATAVTNSTINRMGATFLLRMQEDSGRSRSEEHTSELQSLMRISYAVFCLKKKTKHSTHILITKLININNDI